MGIKIFTKNSLNIICVYRPPDCSLAKTNKLLKFLKENITTNTIILGDFNFPKIDWSSFSGLDSISVIFIDFCLSNNFIQNVSEPTRGNNILDLILTNQKNLLNDIKVGEPFSTSDHNQILLNLATSFKSEKMNIKKRNFSLKNLLKLRAHLFNVKWSHLDSFFSINDKYNGFLSIINSLTNLCIPIKEVNIKKLYKIHYPDEIKNLISRKKELYRLCKINPNKYKIEYKILARVIKQKLKKFTDAKEEGLILGGQKNLFSFIKSKIGQNDKIPPLIGKDGQIHFDNLNKCNTLADIFTESFTDNNEPYNEPPSSLTKITDIEITSYCISKILEKLPNKNSTSPDSISFNLLKNCKDSLSTIISTLFRIILDDRKIPEIWKISYVIPIFKKGDKSDPKNYRPISLTCSLCRILEKILAKNIIEFLHEQDFFSSEQFGFLSNRSTTTQLLSSMNDWYTAMQNKSCTDIIYIDFAKAFDTVNHNFLLFKLKQIGIDGKIFAFIKNFLSGRSFQVKIDETLSKSMPVKSGVPQGSVLGPLLFLIYINDLPMNLPKEVKIKIFADDVKLYIKHSNDQNVNILEKALLSLEEWANTWKLQIAPKKCFALYLGKNNNHIYFLNNSEIPSTETVKDLGVTVDNKLCFSKHIGNITKIAYLKLNQILRILKTRNLKILIQAYKTYVRPQLEYAVEVWNPPNNFEINRIEKVQKTFIFRAFKKCGIKMAKNEKYENRLKICNLQDLKSRRNLLDLTMVYKILNFSTHLNPWVYFHKNIRSNRRALSLRNQNTSAKNHNFFVRTIHPWNKISEEIILSNNSDLFSKRLMKKGLPKMQAYGEEVIFE